MEHSIDSPAMRFLSRVADLMILNLLMTLSFIPILTAGAGFTGMHYVLLRMVRNSSSIGVYRIPSDFCSGWRSRKPSL